VSKELSKRAIDMLLNGATLVEAPCPYCRGVRVMKNGLYALIVEKNLKLINLAKILLKKIITNRRWLPQ